MGKITDYSEITGLNSTVRLQGLTQEASCWLTAPAEQRRSRRTF